MTGYPVFSSGSLSFDASLFYCEYAPCVWPLFAHEAELIFG